MRRTTLALLLAVSLPALADEDIKVGDPAPTFTLPVYNAAPNGPTTASLDSYIGPDADDKGAKAVVLSFFATFCAPCKREMPYLEQLQEMYRDAGLRVLMVSIDRDEDVAAPKIAALVKLNHVTFPILKDRFNFLARRYLGEQAPLPSLFIVDKDGVIRMMNRGYGKDASTFLLSAVQQALGVAKHK
ncbi:MAG TPA: TlpA disulfide reductase family protein [Myxococcales bacterium]|nr:TlpA disulfide reductase family protein [Myxococcales bacterium]